MKCGASPCDPAHIRIYGMSGVGMKPDDSRVVPLCHKHHMEQHMKGERTFWGDGLERMIAHAEWLWEQSLKEKRCK